MMLSGRFGTLGRGRRVAGLAEPGDFPLPIRLCRIAASYSRFP